MNLLQKIALVLFPLNPALLWVDRRLSLERELACDAGVVASTAAPFDYAHCLTRLAEHRLHRRSAGPLACRLEPPVRARPPRPQPPPPHADDVPTPSPSLHHPPNPRPRHRSRRDGPCPSPRLLCRRHHRPHPAGGRHHQPASQPGNTRLLLPDITASRDPSQSSNAAASSNAPARTPKITRVRKPHSQPRLILTNAPRARSSKPESRNPHHSPSGLHTHRLFAFVRRRPIWEWLADHPTLTTNLSLLKEPLCPPQLIN